MDNLFELFGVSSQEELLKYMEENPEEPKVKEMKALLELLETKKKPN